jgi:Na+-driven multidrug efflux pump
MDSVYGTFVAVLEAFWVSRLGTPAVAGVSLVLPALWMGIFSEDFVVLADGAAYLRVVAPFYGFFGAGLMFYFASQGRSRMIWPLIGGALRFIATVGGAWWLSFHAAPLIWVFAAVSAGSMLFGAVNLAGFLLGSRSRRQRTGRVSGAIQA